MIHAFGRGYITRTMALAALASISLFLTLFCSDSKADPPWVLGARWPGWGFDGREHLEGPQAMAGTRYNFPRSYGGEGNGVVDGHGGGCCSSGSDVGGTWMWMRSPEQEKVAAASLFNRYCIRCHGVDGRGIWDIPGIPDFTNARWQISRSDDQIARIIIEGRGAVMPSFRGALSLEEAWAIARYLRTFAPGSQVSKPDLSAPEKTPSSQLPTPTPSK
jgi:cbb3-type cytochrome c oxidase subunit III